MQNIIPEVADTGLVSFSSIKAIFYKEHDCYSMIICDNVGSLIDIIEFNEDDLEETLIDGIEVKPNTIYFVEVTFHDVFFKITKILSELEVENSINNYFKKGYLKDQNFLREVFFDCKELQFLKQLN